MAVLDSGVFGSHRDLVGNFLGFVDTVRERADRAAFVQTASGSFDPSGHGTHVTGTIASTNPAIGVANAASFIGIRVLPDDGESTPGHDGVYEGLRWVLSNHRTYGIRVVNMSLGAPGVNTNTPTNDPEARVIRSLEAQGVTVVTANGNNYATFRTAGVSVPAVNSTIAVVSTWEDAGVGDNLPAGGGAAGFGFYAVDRAPRPDSIAAFSQRSGLPNQVAAPGATIFSTWNGAGGQLYNTIAGTSMASPFVAGVVALMQDAAQTFGGGYLSPPQVLTIIRATGDVITDSTNSSNALVDDNGRLWDLPETGLTFPRVNVYRAVQAVRALFVRSSGDADNTLSSAFAVPAMTPGDGWVMRNRYVGLDGVQSVGASDVDLYRVELLESASITITVEPRAGFTQGRLAVRLFFSDLSFSETYTAPNGYPTTTTVQLPKGVYFFGVSGETNVGYDPRTGTGTVSSYVGGYTLTASADTADPDGALGGARLVELLAVTDADTSTKTMYLSLSGNIGYDTTASGRPFIGTADVDFYAFTAPDDGTVDIDLASANSSLDPYLRIFDNQGRQIASDDDSGTGYNASVRIAVVKGLLYWVGVSSAEGRAYDISLPRGGSAGLFASQGNYNLYLEFSNRDSNGTALVPTITTVGAVNASIGTDNGTVVGAGGSKDVDFYAIGAPSSGLLTFSVAGTFESVLGVYRYDTNRNELIELGRSTGTSHETKISAATGDVFWVAITGKGNDDFSWYVVGSGSGGQTGQYTLTSALGPAVDPTATDDSIGGALVIGGSGLATGVLGRDGNVLRKDVLNDVDFFRYAAQGDGIVTVAVGGIGDLPPDVFVRVFDSTGRELAYNDDASDSTTNAAISLTVTAGQVLFIGVSGYGSSPRSYNPITGTGSTGGIESGDYLMRVVEEGFPVASVSAAEAYEGGEVVFTISLSKPALIPVTVSYSTRDGSAQAGIHYQPRAGTVSIPAGETSARVSVPTSLDGVVDSGRVFSLDLVGPVNASLGTASAPGSVLNFDTLPDGPDLTTAIYFVPAEFLPGAKRNAVGLRLSNDGTLPLRGTYTIELYASADTTFDGSDQLLTVSNQRLALKPGQSRFPLIAFPSPTQIADGSYRIIAVAYPSSTSAERDPSNNNSVSEVAVQIRKPFVELSTQLVAVPVAVKPKGRGQASIRLTNNGNIVATGSVLLNLLMSRVAPGQTEIGTVGSILRKLNLKPGQSVTLRVSFLRPDAPGTAYLASSFSHVGPFPDRDDSNNFVFSSVPVRLS